MLKFDCLDHASCASGNCSVAASTYGLQWTADGIVPFVTDWTLIVYAGILSRRLYSQCPRSMRSKSMLRSGVRPSVCLSRRSTAARHVARLLLSAGMGSRSVDSCGRRVPAVDRYLLQAPARSAANAGSVILRADGRGSTQTCSWLLRVNTVGHFGFSV